MEMVIFNSGQYQIRYGGAEMSGILQDGTHAIAHGYTLYKNGVKYKVYKTAVKKGEPINRQIEDQKAIKVFSKFYE